jgi:hypothetical protein
MGDNFQWRLVDAIRPKKKLCASEVDMSNNSEHQLVAKEIAQTDNISDSELHLSKNSSDHKQYRGLKRKRSVDLNELLVNAKRRMTCHTVVSDAVTHLSPDVLIPVGTQWKTNSCVYNTIITILFNVWHENPVAMMTKWSELNNDTLNYLTAAFEKHVDYYDHMGTNSYTLEQIRDCMRHELARLDREFRFGIYTSACAVMNQLLMSQMPIMKSIHRCSNDHLVGCDERVTTSCEIMTYGAPVDYTVQQYLNNFNTMSSLTCSECNNELIRSF